MRSRAAPALRATLPPKGSAFSSSRSNRLPRSVSVLRGLHWWSILASAWVASVVYGTLPSVTGKPAACSDAAADGSMLTKLLASVVLRSKDRKKKVWPLRMGPPSVPPHCHCPKPALGRSMGSPWTS